MVWGGDKSDEYDAGRRKGRTARWRLDMRIGLIDVDGRKYPNLALMRISAYHKARGDEVEWWWSDLEHYDKVYMSKLFSDAYTNDVPEPMNADEVQKGGSGYCIYLGEDGREHFDQSKNVSLPGEIEGMFPDYSIYPQHTFAVSMTSRGCPRGCGFCHVARKEGQRSVRVGSVSDFWSGQDEIKVIDPNIISLPREDKIELLQQYLDTGAVIDFSQGIDIRLVTDEDVRYLKRMRMRDVHFAWDNPKEDLRPMFERYKSWNPPKLHGNYGMVYVLTNFNSTVEEDEYRVYTLRDMGFEPYISIYDKPHADKEKWRLQQWVNNKRVFHGVEFKDFDNNFMNYVRRSRRQEAKGAVAE